MKDYKPIKFIILQIHNLKDVLFIQWIRKEYYIKKHNIRNIINKYSLNILETLLLFIIFIVRKTFPPKNIEDIIRLFLLVICSCVQSGIGIAIYINGEKDTK